VSSTAERTHRVVQGALRGTIDAHGPITADLVPSATKRVVAQLRSAAEGGAKLLDPNDPARVAVEAVYKRLEKLRHGHARLRDQHLRLRAVVVDRCGDDAVYEAARRAGETLGVPSWQTAVIANAVLDTMGGFATREVERPAS
jgi:hypothetical protein